MDNRQLKLIFLPVPGQLTRCICPLLEEFTGVAPQMFASFSGLQTGVPAEASYGTGTQDQRPTRLSREGGDPRKGTSLHKRVRRDEASSTVMRISHEAE